MLIKSLQIIWMIVPKFLFFWIIYLFFGGWLLYYIVLVLSYIDINLPVSVHMFPILNPTPTALPIPSLWVIPVHQPQAPCTCIEPGLAICFIYDILHVSCHSPKSSHPLPLPQNQKDSSIHLCLFCCLAYRVIVAIFLNSIYMHLYTVLVFLFLTYFTLYNRLQSHSPH